MYSPLIITIILTVLSVKNTNGEVGEENVDDVKEKQYAIKINKCCEINEIMVDSLCRLAVQYNQSVWVPLFKSKDGRDAKVKYITYVHGMPDCAASQMSSIFILGQSKDELNLLVDGRLRHLIHHEHSSVVIKDNPLVTNTLSTKEQISSHKDNEPSSNIHDYDKFCMDKILIPSTNITGLYALVCIPEVKLNWRESGLLMKAILDLLFKSP